MIHTAALFASLGSLALMCAIYYCNILSARGSWLRNTVLASTLLSLLIGLFPIALAASVVGLWSAIGGELSLVALLAAGTDLVSLGATLATIAVFRAAVVATYRESPMPTNVTPLTPRPTGTGEAHRTLRKAA